MRSRPQMNVDATAVPFTPKTKTRPAFATGIPQGSVNRNPWNSHGDTAGTFDFVDVQSDAKHAPWPKGGAGNPYGGR